MTIERYSPLSFVNDLRQITSGNDDDRTIINQVRPLAKRLALNKSWLHDSFYRAGTEQGFGIHLLHEETDHTLALFAVSWLPKRGAPPHNHGTWAVGRWRGRPGEKHFLGKNRRWLACGIR